MNQATPTKFCADCQHLRITPQIRHPQAICAAPQMDLNPVTGDPIQQCKAAREFPFGHCGPDAALFQPRDATTWVAWISRPGPMLDAKVSL